MSTTKTDVAQNAVPMRRALILGGIGALFTALPGARIWAATLSAPASGVQVENFSASGSSAGLVRVPKVIRSEGEWAGKLPAISFQVMRKEGTERPYTGKYWNNHADGIYRCLGCDTALFDSKTKFESGTGWPSFWQPISAHNVAQNADNSLGMQRDAISCPLCDAHLGHVFDDGPRPTGLRYCMNSAALNFFART